MINLSKVIIRIGIPFFGGFLGAIGVAAVSPAYEINFAVAAVGGRPPALGAISLLPGRLESALVEVPNATFIAFGSTGADPEVEWIATFVVEA